MTWWLEAACFNDAMSFLWTVSGRIGHARNWDTPVITMIRARGMMSGNHLIPEPELLLDKPKANPPSPTHQIDMDSTAPTALQDCDYP